MFGSPNIRQSIEIDVVGKHKHHYKISVETIPGMGGMKKNGGGDEFKYDTFDI
jgi:hypothetical protein